MSKTAHTPGPWEIDWNNTHAGTIATVHGHTKGWADIWSMQWIESGMGEEVMDANARLIAAAPDFAEGATEFELYEQAVAREDDVAAMQHYAKAAVTLRNALAKARGEQP